MNPTTRKLFAEALGTALLLAVVIGSGIMAERLSGGNVAIALLANTLATVGGLYILIEVFGPVSGAHFNPAVSAVMAWRRELPLTMLAPYVVAQLAGAMLGAWLAHAMFDLPILQWSTKLRGGQGQWMARAWPRRAWLLVILRAPAARVAPHGRRLHWFGILVHRLDLVRQPGCGIRAHVLGHLCWDRTLQRSGLCVVATGWCSLGGTVAPCIGRTCTSSLRLS